MNFREIPRREFLAASAMAVTAVAAPSWVTVGGRLAPGEARGAMYGMIAKITTVSGKRDEFIAILLHGTGDMPGCLSYVVAKDASDTDAIWVSEVWDSKASHDASLSLSSVKDAMAKGRPMIAGFSNNVATEPVGGVGLPKQK
jgi:quinol monooxygenase YgiN